MYFTNLYLKLLLANKDYVKAVDYINKYATSFQLWIDKGLWILRILNSQGETQKLMDQLESMLIYNY